MQPQGATFNIDHIHALVDRINGINQCSELQEVVDEAYASIQAQLNGISSQMAALQPILALLKPPKDLETIITWVKTFITAFLGPYLKPVSIDAAQVAQLTAAIATLSAAIDGAAGRLTSCSITVPDLTPPSMPPEPEPEPEPEPQPPEAS